MNKAVAASIWSAASMRHDYAGATVSWRFSPLLMQDKDEQLALTSCHQRQSALTSRRRSSSVGSAAISSSRIMSLSSSGYLRGCIQQQAWLQAVAPQLDGPQVQLILFFCPTCLPANGEKMARLEVVQRKMTASMCRRPTKTNPTAESDAGYSFHTPAWAAP